MSHPRNRSGLASRFRVAVLVGLCAAPGGCGDRLATLEEPIRSADASPELTDGASLDTGSAGASLVLREPALRLRLTPDVTGDRLADLIVVSRDQRMGLIFGQPRGVLSPEGADARVFWESDPSAAASFSVGRADLVGAGDIDGDGHGDLVTGVRPTAPLVSDMTPEPIRDFYVANGPLIRADVALGPLAGDVTIRAGSSSERLLTQPGQTLTGHPMFGGMSDVDGDGVGDVILVEPFSAPVSANAVRGAARILYGPRSDLRDGKDTSTVQPLVDGDPCAEYATYSAFADCDLDGDGQVEAVLVGLSMRCDHVADGSNPWRITARVARTTGRAPALVDAIPVLNVSADEGYVSCGGDLNGDGVDDLLVGPNWSLPETSSPRGAVYLGPFPTGATAQDAPRRIEIDSPDRPQILQVSPAGDLDGDGYDDLIIAAWFAATVAPPQAERSTLYLLRGPFHHTISIDDAALTLSLESRFVTHLAAGQDLDGDGLYDFAVETAEREYSRNPAILVVYGAQLRWSTP